MRRKNTQLEKVEFINPYRKEEINYWSKKWNVSLQTLRAAMDVTGSSNVQNIKQFLQRLKFIRSN